MSSQNQGSSRSSTADHPRKLKRGCLCRDESVQGNSAPVTPASDSMEKNKQTVETSDLISDDMLGQMVSGVIEGSFDAGYLLSVKVGDTNTYLRGVVFQPGKFTPITAANDVAPQAKVYKRIDIPIPFVKAQVHLLAASPSSGKSEKPIEHKNYAPNLPDQGLHIGLQSGATAASESQSTSILIPAVNNLPINDTALPKRQKVLLEQILDSELQNDKIVGQDQSLLGFEAFKLMKGPNINLEALKTSEAMSATFTASLPATETVNLKPQVEHQAVCSDLKLQELFHDDVISLDPINNKTPKFSEPKAQPIASEPTGINIFEQQTSSRQGIDISQDTQLGLARKIIGEAYPSHMDGLSASEAATTTNTAPCSASMTRLPIMIIGAETIPSVSKPAAEKSLLPRMVVPEASSSLMSANTNSVESNAKDAVPPAQS